jgi:hypothetical protein
MNSLTELKARLATLETQATEIRGSGECLRGVRLERAAAGGTASGKSQQIYKYGRLRAGKGKLLSNGSKSQYVPLSELGNVEAAIARGRELSKVEKEIKKVQAKCDRISIAAARLGLPLP